MFAPSCSFTVTLALCVGTHFWPRSLAAEMLPPNDDVCRPAVTANYTGAAGFVHLSVSIQVGWGNLGLILFQVLLLAVATDRTPVLAGEHANRLRKYFELTPKVRFLPVPQQERPGDVHIGRELPVSGRRRPINTTFKMAQIAADVASVVERPLDSSSAIAVSPALWPSQVVHGLLEHAWHLSRLVEHSSCLAPAFLFPKTEVSREVRRAAGGTTAVHVRTCQPGGGSNSKRGNRSVLKDTCARNNREILTCSGRCSGRSTVAARRECPCTLSSRGCGSSLYSRARQVARVHSFIRHARPTNQLPLQARVLRKGRHGPDYLRLDGTRVRGADN